MAFTNETKNSSTFLNQNKSGISKWADTAVLWNDPIATWSAVENGFTNETKNTSSFTNLTKN